MFSRATRRVTGFVLTGGLAAFALASNEEGSSKNSAFVFIKPHANTRETQKLLSKVFQEKDIKITSEGELTGPEIDKGMLIDQHYYAIASKATLLKPADMPVPADKFEAGFGLSWKKALGDGVVYNALDACQELGVDAAGLDKLWATAKKVKFGGGFYCGLIKNGEKSLYVFNGFFMEMRGKFVQPGTRLVFQPEFDRAVLCAFSLLHPPPP